MRVVLVVVALVHTRARAHTHTHTDTRTHTRAILSFNRPLLPLTHSLARAGLTRQQLLEPADEEEEASLKDALCTLLPRSLDLAQQRRTNRTLSSSTPPSSASRSSSASGRGDEERARGGGYEGIAGGVEEWASAFKVAWLPFSSVMLGAEEAPSPLTLDRLATH